MEKIIDKRKKQKQENLLRSLVQVFVGLIVFAICFNSVQDIDFNQGHDMMNAQVNTLQEYNFIRDITPIALQEQKETGLKASITLSQACVESDFGRSSLAYKYNNLFGMKAYGNVPKVTLETQEYVNGKMITVDGNFRTYSSWKTSIQDHTKLFVNGVDWDHNRYKNVLTAKTYQEAAQNLQKDGYATDPDYTEKLITTIQTFKFDHYDI